jgi:hypothetical protein
VANKRLKPRCEEDALESLKLTKVEPFPVEEAATVSGQLGDADSTNINMMPHKSWSH